MPSLGDFLNSIHKNKNNLLEDPNLDPSLVEKDYKKLTFILNRCLSYFPDTLLYSQELNMRSALDGKPQYLFYLYGVSKKPRFAKGMKIENSENLGIVKEYYNYNSKKARKALEILTDEDIEYIKDRLKHGGVGKKKT